MAGDWIKMRTDLYRDPKVCLMADILSDEKGDLSRYVSQQIQRNMTVTRNVTRNACVGALLSVWGVMRHRGVRVDDDLKCFGVGLWVIDDIADLPGFGVAMAAARWVVETEDCLIFPRFFDEYNVEPDGKQKSKNAERQARYRGRKKAKSEPGSNVTGDVTRDVTVTPREEESRVEKSKDTPLPPKGETKAKGTIGEWDIPDGFDTPEVRKALSDFEAMRASIGKKIKSRANVSKSLKGYDSPVHLVYAIEFAIGNEYQGIKPDYRPGNVGQGAKHLPPKPKKSNLPVVDKNWEPA